MTGIGTDLFAVARMQRRLAEDTGFPDAVFTPREIADCAGRPGWLAARFAAKEAFMKALGTGWQYGIRFTDIEVRDDSHQPRLRVQGQAEEIMRTQGITRLHVALTLTRTWAAAVVALEN